MIVDRLLALRGTLEDPNVPLSAIDSEHYLFAALGGRMVSSGQTVTPEGAYRLGAVYACVRIIAETLASLPLPVYRRMDQSGRRGKERAPQHPLWRLLHDRPNPDMSSFTFREVMQASLLTWGNAYAEIERTEADTPRYLWPIHPSRVRVERRESAKAYFVWTDGEMRPVQSSRILHIPGLGFDGLVGFSPISMAAQAIGAGLAMDDYGARFFANDARPSVVITWPGKFKNQEAVDRFKARWQAAHGTKERHGTAVLEEGMDIKQLTIPPEQAQFLESRRFTVTEIARIFRVPPHLLADLERATFSNIEHQGIEFVTHTLRPWTVRWEQALNWDLFGERSPFFAEFLIDGLLRGDIQSRYEAYAVGRQNGWLSADDIRELENMNPLPGDQGSIYLVPLNSVPADRINEVIDAQTEPEPAPTAPAAPANGNGATDDDRAVRDALSRALSGVIRRSLRREAKRVARAGKATDAAAMETTVREIMAEEAALLCEELEHILAGHPAVRTAVLDASGQRTQALLSAPDLPKLLQRWETEQADDFLRQLPPVAPGDST